MGPVCLSAEKYLLKELCAGQVLYRLHSSGLQVPPATETFQLPAILLQPPLHLEQYKDEIKDQICLFFCLCSEGNSGDNSIVVYYQSEFEIHVSQQASLEAGMESMKQVVVRPDGQQGRLQLRPSDGLSVSSIISQGRAAHD